MKYNISARGLLLASALILPAISMLPANAQKSTLSDNCQILVDRLAKADGKIVVGDKPNDVNTLQRLAEANEDADCKLVVEKMQISATDTKTATEKQAATATASDTVTRRISIEEEAQLRGMAVVDVPKPEVMIEQGGAEVNVTPATPDVTIKEQRATILVRQPQQTIKVDMPAPTITISQQAPEIIITMPPPGVDVATAQPTVEVRMPDPVVQVTQGKPELRFNLTTQEGATQADQKALTSQSGSMTANNATGANNAVAAGNANANVQTRMGKAVVQMAETDQKPKVSISRTEPEVRYKSSEPTVEFARTGEPKVSIEQSGEPKVTFKEFAGGQNDQKSEKGATRASNMQASGDTKAANLTRADKDAQIERNAEMRSRMSARDGDPAIDVGVVRDITVGDLIDEDVYNTRGEELGEIERFVRIGDRDYVIIEHGGILGIGNSETAIPLDQLTMRGDELLLRGMTEEQFEELPEFDGDDAVELKKGDAIRINIVDK